MILGVGCAILLVGYIQESTKYEKLQVENKQIINSLQSCQNSLQSSQSSLKTCSNQKVQFQQSNEQLSASLQSTRTSLQSCQNSLQSSQTSLQSSQQSIKECNNLFESLKQESTIDHFVPSICNNKKVIMSRVSSVHYIQYKSKDHPKGIYKEKGVTYSSEIAANNVKNYITNDDSQIKNIANYIISACNSKTAEQKANTILEFVHSIPYEKDTDVYAKYPIETLAESSGDCEDLSILAATLMKSVGLDVILFDFPGHIAVGVALPKQPSAYGNIGSVKHNGKTYYYCETTGTTWPHKPASWKVGQMPEEYNGKSVTILEI